MSLFLAVTGLETFLLLTQKLWVEYLIYNSFLFT
jgi:hypothetical protein